MAGPLKPSAAALAFLAAADFQHTRELRSVWRDRPDDIPELNFPVVSLISDELFARAAAGTDGNPLGRVVLGQAGAGKTHLLGTLRREVWRRGGWLVLLDLLDIGDFWATTALGFVDALGRPMTDQRTQGEAVMAILLPRRGILWRIILRAARWLGGARHAKAAALLARLRKVDRGGAQTHRDVILAFAALHGADPAGRDYAQTWLQGGDIGAAGQAAIGVLQSSIVPRRAVEGLSWLMGFAGPTLLVVDQIDAIISVAHAQDPKGNDAATRRVRAVLDDVAGGLMALRDTLHRSMTVLSTLETTWEILTTRAVRSFVGRFHAPVRLAALSSADLARRLIEARLARSRAAANFTPPYPSWPFRREAFETAIDFTPRQLLQACEVHRSHCLLREEVAELRSFLARDLPEPSPPSPAATPLQSDIDLDALYERLRAGAAVAPLTTDNEPAIAALLGAALEALLRETELPSTQNLVLETDVAGLNARLRLIDHAAGGMERHFCFCLVPQTTARAVQPRVRAAITASGVESALPFRHLVIVRSGSWPSGPVTQHLVAALDASGATILAPDSGDLRRFSALREMLDGRVPGLDAWLRRRRPVTGSAFFQAVGVASAVDALAAARPADTAAVEPDPPPSSPLMPRPQPPPPRSSAPAPSAPLGPDLPLGLRPADREPVTLPLRLLPRHVAVIAGSGSGKTVFLRRLVEEAALAGVPAIVLDSHNDLVRLGMPWPEWPPGFTQADQDKAARFAATVEAVVWTPGRNRGNPLSLAVLPDFAALRNDPDECGSAIGMAAASLMGLLPARGQARLLREGVLMDALRFFASKGGGGLDALIDLLRDLPSEATAIDRAPKLAAEIANALVAAQARNPLLEGAHAVSDPAALLAGTNGRTRVSVISLAGLPSDEARQDFVARLLMALFGHIRRHPAGRDRPVAGLLVMDEAQNFAPSAQGVSSRAATLALVQQARKYGLGMVFATQMPRAIDAGIIGNCTTQLFGRLNAPAAMETVREMLASRGGAPDDLGRLGPGQFYLTTEGRERPQKFQAPLCLSHHPANPPSEDEVVAIAAVHGVDDRLALASIGQATD